MLENYNECYHCGPVHPELCRLVPAFKQRGGSDLDWERGIPHRDGAWTFTASGTTGRLPFAGLDDDERTRHKGELIYPNFLLSLSAEHVAAFYVFPRAPGRTTIVNEFLFHPDEMGKPGFDPADAVEFWDLVNRQDWSICESVQRGMSSRVFRTGYYAPMESASLDIRRYVGERTERTERTEKTERTEGGRGWRSGEGEAGLRVHRRRARRVGERRGVLAGAPRGGGGPWTGAVRAGARTG